MRSTAAVRRFDLILACLTAWAALTARQAIAVEGLFGRPPRVVDEARAEASGIRRLQGQHLTLYTDLPPNEEVDALPAVFDAAYPQWCRYFGVEADVPGGWRGVGCLIQQEERFKAAALLTDEVPAMEHGYALDFEFWFREQPSIYFRRHLLLHEGTHVFMNTRLGGCGPPWYMEGIAELLATHHWEKGRLELAAFPAAPEDVPYWGRLLQWGRIKILKDAVAAGQARSLDEILALAPDDFQDTRGYAWAWGAAAFLDGHPRYRQRFRRLLSFVARDDFDAQFRQLFAMDARELADEWRLFLAEVDYGYDLARSAVVFAPADPLPEQGATVRVAADRGWQASGYQVEPGRAYHFAAKGRYELARDPQPWPCEPGGVTIHYYRGRPLGQLLASVRPDEASAAHVDAPWQSIPIGLEATWTPTTSGTLYFKINESPARLGDNSGSLDVRIDPLSRKPGLQ